MLAPACPNGTDERRLITERDGEHCCPERLGAPNVELLAQEDLGSSKVSRYSDDADGHRFRPIRFRLPERWMPS
jgi:hypothetical protein